MYTVPVKVLPLINILLNPFPEKSLVRIYVNKPDPGKPQNVSKNNTEVKEAVLTATYTFNNESNDAFLFKASAIDEAQRQVRPPIYFFCKSSYVKCTKSINILWLFNVQITDR